MWQVERRDPLNSERDHFLRPSLEFDDVVHTADDADGDLVVQAISDIGYLPQ
jgi:hypothetical protein